MSHFAGVKPHFRVNMAGLILAAAVLSSCGTPQSTTSSSASNTTTSSSAASSSAGPIVGPDYDHCTDGGFQPHVTNGLINDGGYAHSQNGQVDLSVEPTVFNYMYENGWQDAHVLWHQARTCGGFGGALSINGLPSACKFTDLLPKQSDCQGDINGLDFFSGHRTMMFQLRELWPDATEQFTGWQTFPKSKEDYPPELRSYFRDWDSAILQNADIADNIEQHLDMFPTEGALGTWISCNIMPNAPGGADFSTARNLHFGLHNNGVPSQNQKHAANNNNVNIDSYLFWKLHGWIDNVWERYRVAKGKTRNDPDYKAEMLEQCREMDAWREIAMDTRGEEGHPNQDDSVPSVVVESGFFHTVIRPALEDAGCSTCHGAGEQAGLRLGYNITSKEIVERLIDRSSSYAQGYKMVVPGKPEQSWLYMKASGMSVNSGVTCQGSQLCAREMPGLSQQAIDDIKQWILDGAQVPVILN